MTICLKWPQNSPECLFVIFIAIFFVWTGCGEDTGHLNGNSSEDCVQEPAFPWCPPPGFPSLNIPDDNPMSLEKVELGRHLFYDNRLSGNQTYSCSSCHIQEYAFTDGLSNAEGATGELHPRGSMSLANAGYFSVLGWSNPLLLQLEQQALIPMFGEFPVELGLAGMELELLQRLSQDEAYQEMFQLSFPEDEDPITIENIVKAISAFERTMYSANSPYDQWLQEGVQCEDSLNMSDSACRGMELFFNEKTECFHCHGGITFSDSLQSGELFFTEIGFHNNGLYNIDGEGGYPEDNQGLFEITGIASDMGRFKAPTLRNIELTAPYMHDGSILTLEEVLEHYVAGGRLIEEGSYAGDGRENPYKNDFIRGFELTEEEFDDIISFLKSLTDLSFINNPSFSSPFN